MPELKILHTSDLLLGRKENDQAFAAITSQLALKLRGEVDYIVISGNLTDDGRPESFEAAEKALALLAERLLRRDRDGVRRNRILIVPSRHDAQNGQDYAAFKAFHDRFFGDEIAAQRVEPFDAERGVSFRQLNNVSLIGLCYWRKMIHRGDRIIPTLASLAPAVREAGDRLVKIAYTRQTPTIIASAEPIVLSGAAGEEAGFLNIRAALRDSFMKAIHLYGAGETMSSIPSLWTLESIGLGTGMRSNGFWPFTANLLQIHRPSLDDKVTVHPLLSSTLYYQWSAELPLEKKEQIQGELDLFYGADPALSRQGMYEALLVSLEAALRDNPQVIVRGFPGAGKLKFFEYMKNRDRLVKQRVHVISRKVSGDVGEALINEIQERLDTFRRAQARDPQLADVWPLLLLHDGRRATLRNEEKSEKLRALNSIFGPDLYIVLLQPEDDYTLAAEGIDHRERVLPFPRLEIDAMRNLVGEFSCCAPADEGLMKSVTGGYAGFSEMILEEAAGAFGRLSGAEPMREQTATAMLERAVVTDRVRKESRLHREILARKAGDDICVYIHEKVQKKRRDSGASTVAELPPIDIVVDELKDQLRTWPTKLAAVDTTLEKLSEAGILGPKETNDGRTTYRVEVLAPFAAWERTIPVTPAPSSGTAAEAWPAVADEDLDQRADVVIITALPAERDAVLRKLENKRQLDPSEEDTLVYHFAKLPVTFPSGKKAAYRVVVTSLVQMGQVNAALVADKASNRWKPRAVLLVGIAGGVKTNGVAIGDVVVANQVAYYEEQKLRPGHAEIRWQMIPIDPRFLGASQNFAVESSLHLLDVKRPDDRKPRLHFGPVATGDKVIADEAVLRKLKETVPKLTGVEMEAWGVATAAFQASHPRRFFMIRGISDLADAEKDSAAVDDWRPYACDVAAAYAIALLRSGPLPDAAPKGGDEQ